MQTVQAGLPDILQVTQVYTGHGAGAGVGGHPRHPGEFFRQVSQNRHHFRRRDHQAVGVLEEDRAPAVPEPVGRGLPGDGVAGGLAPDLGRPRLGLAAEGLHGPVNRVDVPEHVVGGADRRTRCPCRPGRTCSGSRGSCGSPAAAGCRPRWGAGWGPVHSRRMVHESSDILYPGFPPGPGHSLVYNLTLSYPIVVSEKIVSRGCQVADCLWPGMT